MSGDSGRLTHLDARGRARMVDVGDKPSTARECVARGELHMERATLERIVAGGLPKGDVLATARIAGIQAAKRTHEWIPLAHAIPLDAVEISLEPDPGASGGARLRIEARVRAQARTGVEMEALVAVSAAALTVYDMCKAVDRGMRVDAVRLVSKQGGRSGAWRRPDEPPEEEPPDPPPPAGLSEPIHARVRMNRERSGADQGSGGRGPPGSIGGTCPPRAVSEPRLAFVTQPFWKPAPALPSPARALAPSELDPDRELVDRWHAGDAAAFESLIRRHERRVFGLLMRMLGNVEEAEDVAQETFLNLHRHGRRFRGQSRFSTFLYRVAVNAALNRRRSLGRRRARTEALEQRQLAGEDLPASPRGPEDAAAGVQIQHLVQRAILTLPPHLRMPLVLFDIEGLSYSDVAGVLRVAEGTVKSRIHRARQALRERLRGLVDEPAAGAPPAEETSG